MFRLPFSKNKRYLSGIDWIINMIDHMSKKVTGVGNQSQIVLELSGCPDPDDLRERLDAFIKLYPIVNGRIARDYPNLAPYWKVENKETRPPKLEICEIGEGDDSSQIFAILDQAANKPFGDDKDHLAFYLISSKDRSLLVMAFDHRLLDARGAEAFLSMFQLEQQEKGEHCKKVSLREPAHLEKWQEKFEAGQQTSRMLRPMAENIAPVFPVSKNERDKEFRFKIISFDKEETAHIVDKAYSEAGYLMFMPYVLAVTVQTLHKLFIKKNIQTGDYIIPVSTDMRAPDELPEKLFFNYVSFFMFRFIPDKVSDFTYILDDLKKQMYDQVKSKSLQNFNEASYLLRIIPLSILGNLMQGLKQWPSGSFCSSYVGENAYSFSKFMEEDVLNIFHMPRPPVSPGLGVYFNQFQGKLNTTISYKNGMLSEDDVASVACDIKNNLTL